MVVTSRPLIPLLTLQQHQTTQVPRMGSAASFLPALNMESSYSECSFLFFPPIYPSFRICSGTLSSRQHYLASTSTLHFGRPASWHIPPLCPCILYKTLSLQPHAAFNCGCRCLPSQLHRILRPKGLRLIHLCPKYPSAWHTFSD